MNETSRRRLFAVGALLVAGGALAVVSMSSMGDELVYYWSPSELLAKGDQAKDATVRIMGMVEAGSVDWKPEAQTLAFRVTDGTKTVAVQGQGAPPQMFREGIGVVVEGQYAADQVFKTNRLMVNHSNEYRAPSDGGTPDDKQWKDSLTKAD